MVSPAVSELFKQLHYRGEILRCLQEGTSDSRVIASETGKSRSSVDRDIRLLKADDYIRERVNDYDLTRPCLDA